MRVRDKHTAGTQPNPQLYYNSTEERMGVQLSDPTNRFTKMQRKIEHKIETIKKISKAQSSQPEISKSFYKSNSYFIRRVNNFHSFFAEFMSRSGT